MHRALGRAPVTGRRGPPARIRSSGTRPVAQLARQKNRENWLLSRATR